jgi:hypothetical protein
MVPATTSWLAALTDVNDSGPNRAENRLRRFEVGGFATDHDRQRPLDRRLFPTADRSVEHPQSAGGCFLGDRSGNVRPDGAHVDDQSARLSMREHALVAQNHGPHVRRVGQHRDDHLGAGDRFSQRFRGRAASGGEGFTLGAGTCVANDVVAGADEVARHG